MLKSEFIKKIQQMSQPAIREFYPDDNWGLISTCWVIEDKVNLSHKFCTPSIKLSHLEWLRGKNLAQFYKREDVTRKKYYRWFQELIALRDVAP